MNAIGMSRRHRAELNGASESFMRPGPFCCGDDKRLYVPGLCSPSTLTAGRTARPSQCGPARFRPKGGHRGAAFQLTAEGVQVRFVKQQLTFTGEDTVMANLLLSVMGAFAEFERSLIGERQREGIALAKGARCLPRPQEISYRGPGGPAAPARAGAGEARTALAHDFGISRETVYQHLRTAP